MDLVPAVVVLGILLAITLLVVVPILVFCLCKYRRKAQGTSNKSLTSGVECGEVVRERTIKQQNSLPCRLKKTTTVLSSNGTRSAAGESGVYDMSELSTPEPKYDSVTAIYVDKQGDDRRLSLFGDLNTEDLYVIKSVICQFLQHEYRNSQSLSSIDDANKHTKYSMNLDDVIISGLQSAATAYVNEGYQQDESETRTIKKALSQTFSSLARRKRNRKLEKMQSNLSLIPAELSMMSSRQTDLIGSSGGELILDLGIKLTIPPGALQESTEITIGITYDLKHRPILTDEQAILTPVIFCQPLGLKFKEPVTITIPHCAESVQETWRINIHSSQTEVESTETDWKILQIGEYESRTFYKSTLDICLNQLSMLCLSGIPKQTLTAKKRMKLLAAVLDSTPDHVAVFCVSDYQRSQEEREEPLMIEPGNQPVKLAIDNLSLDWIQTNPHSNQISFLDIWQERFSGTTLEFSPKTSSTLSMNEGNQTSLTYDINAWQLGNVSEKHVINVTVGSANSTQGASKTTNRRRREVFTEKLKWDVVFLLDPAHPDGNDWRKLAFELGISQHMVEVMEEKPSPTKELLRLWEEKGHGCIKSFVAMAVKINRLDVAEKIEEHVGKLYLETLPNHKCDDHC